MVYVVEFGQRVVRTMGRSRVIQSEEDLRWVGEGVVDEEHVGQLEARHVGRPVRHEVDIVPKL